MNRVPRSVMALCLTAALLASRSHLSAAPGELNVVEHGADPTGERDATELLTSLHATGKPIYYPNGTYRFNDRKLNLSGGVRFESPQGVVVRNDVSPHNILQFDDFGNFVGLQHNHLQLDEQDLGGPARIDVGSLVSPPLSTVEHDLRVDLLAHWYNDGGLEHRRVHAPARGWIGWYYWSWNFHRTTRPEGHDPARHPLLGFYRGDDPTVLDWQCYWLREYGIRGVMLYGPTADPVAAWQAPDHRNHWIYQLLNNVPNFRRLRYVMTAHTPWVPTSGATEAERREVEQAWESLISDVYLRYPNFYAVERDGKTFPVLYVHAEAALRGVFDSYVGARGTVAFYRRIAELLRSEGYGGVALFARQDISGLVDLEALESDGVLHFRASYAGVNSTGATYAELVANYDPPVDAGTILNLCTAKHSHTHPSAWHCPGHSPALFGEMLGKAVAHVERHDMPRIITCYNVGEWAEGGPQLQPNMQDRFGYLEAVREAVTM